MLRVMLAFVTVVLAAVTARADVYVLESGGRVSGELLNPDESPRQKYVIKTPHGGQIALERSQVKQVIPTRPAEAEYQKIRPRYPDTVEGQWELAQWCLQQQLPQQREAHLRRVIELDPNHAEARRALGYSQFNGKWATQDEVMTERGYRRYKGAWRLPQEIELMENKRTAETSEKDWFQKLKRWRTWLADDRNDQGRKNILAIDDARAVKALCAALKEDPREPARLLYIEVLAKLGTPDALKTLAARSLEDPVEEVRLSCIDALKPKKSPDVAAFYIGKLQSKENPMINRAALALGQMGEPAAIGPLIDALVTVHKFKISDKPAGQMSSTFGTKPGGSGSPGGGGMSMGGGPKFSIQQLSNPPVLDALVALTGVNFNFDKQAWKAWYASQHKRETLDARRDGR